MCAKNRGLGYLAVMMTAGLMTPSFSCLFPCFSPVNRASVQSMTRRNAVPLVFGALLLRDMVHRLPRRHVAPRPSVWRCSFAPGVILRRLFASSLAFQPSILTSPFAPCPAARMWRTLLHL